MCRRENGDHKMAEIMGMYVTQRPMFQPFLPFIMVLLDIVMRGLIVAFRDITRETHENGRMALQGRAAV
jgi:hypothetical protein